MKHDKENRGITVLGIDHLVLKVKDLAASVAFYRHVLGAKVERQMQTPRLVQLRIGQSLLDLVPGGKGRGSRGASANLDHYAVRVAAPDEALLAKRLARYGLKAPAPAVRYGAEGYGPSIYFHDLDGTMVELKGPATRPRINRTKRRKRGEHSDRTVSAGRAASSAARGGSSPRPASRRK